MRTELLAAIVALCIASAGQASEGLARVTIERDAIFTPGHVRLVVQLGDRAELAGPYKARLTATLAGIVIRDQTISVSRSEPGTFDIPFPKVFARSEVRCRVELFLDGEFIEATERPVLIWPSVIPLDSRIRPKGVWVLDASGGLQRAFRDLDVNAVDAAFQGVRDFATPSIVFIGELADANAARLILARASQTPRQPVITFLRQEQFPKEFEVEAVKDANAPRSVVCDMNTPLLKDLTRGDILSLLPKAASIEAKAKNGFTRSFLTERAGSHEATRTYLSTLSAAGRLNVFCQLPVMDPCDPRQVTLLHNLIEFAAEERAAADRR